MLEVRFSEFFNAIRPPEYGRQRRVAQETGLSLPTVRSLFAAIPEGSPTLTTLETALIGLGQEDVLLRIDKLLIECIEEHAHNQSYAGSPEQR